MNQFDTLKLSVFEAVQENLIDEDLGDDMISFCENADITNPDHIDVAIDIADTLMAVSDYRENQLMMEGATTELNFIFKKYSDDFRDTTKELKDCIKRKDYRKANSKCNELENIIKQFDKEIDKIPDNLGSIVTGNLYNNVAFQIKGMLIAIPTLGFGTLVVVAKELIDQVEGLIRLWKQNNGKLTVSMLNGRRTKIKGVIRNFEKILASYRRYINNKGFDVKESENKNDLKLEIHESCQYGEITEEERDILLDLL